MYKLSLYSYKKSDLPSAGKTFKVQDARFKKNAVILFKRIIDSVYKHFHQFPISIAHTTFELLADKVRRVIKTPQWTAVPMMTSVPTQRF